MYSQALVDEAFADLISRSARTLTRARGVMAAYLASHKKFGPLYKKLAE